MYPTEMQTKDLINNITRAIAHNPREYECNCRCCPWCLHLTPTTLIRCVRCNAALISVGRFMDQGSQGMPRTLDSEILIEVDDESTIEGAIDETIDVAQRSVVEDEIIDELQLVEESAAGIDLDALHEEQEKAKDADENVDAYGELYDYSNECITVSHQSSTKPPAMCLNTEEICKVLDEIVGYLIFQRKDILDDFLSLSFSEMKARMDERRTPFTRRQFFCPAFIDDDTMLPRAPTKEEYMEWGIGDGRKKYQEEREQWMWEHWYGVKGSSILFCDNLDHCFEVIRTRAMIWKLYLWPYTTMRVNEFLTPLIDGGQLQACLRGRRSTHSQARHEKCTRRFVVTVRSIKLTSGIKFFFSPQILDCAIWSEQQPAGPRLSPIALLLRLVR